MSPHIQEKFNEEVKSELIRLQTEQELRTNPVYHDFFQQFNAASVESFIRSYARRKAFYLTRGRAYLVQEDPHMFRYKSLAEECIWAIQQKKLFNMQCQWRAEQVRLKGVEHSSQFQFLGSNIQHCPYITPVSKVELDLFIRFLKSDRASLDVNYDDWQDYEAIKAEYQSGVIPTIDGEYEQQIPAWYRFYDSYMGTSALLDLPDVRGEKEKRYRSIARQRQLEQIKLHGCTRELDERPYLSVHDAAVFESFAMEFEDPHTLRYCKAVESFQRQLEEQLDLDQALEKLRSAHVTISIKANADWKSAIVEAARQFEFGQIASMLPAVLEEYHFRLENGINFPQSLMDKKRSEQAFIVCENAKRQILDGRKILGEPENMRF